MNKKKIIYLCVIIVLIFSILFLLVVLNKLNTNLTIEEQISKAKKPDEYTRDDVGIDYNTIFNKYNTVKFGKYYQDKEKKTKKDIEWFVLDKKDGYALLLSKYVLDVRQMSDEEKECQWVETILREWLNKEFYDIAFNQNEKNKIIDCELENFNIPLSLHKKQEKTKDKVFILSLEELQTYFYHTTKYRLVEIATTATEYAFSKNVLVDYQQMKNSEEAKLIIKELNIPLSKLNIKTTTYWTRTFKDNKCLMIDYDGSVKGNVEQESNITKENGIRPAIWINYDNIENIKKHISYDMFKKDDDLKEPNIEFDLTQTPIELGLYKMGERRAYYKQLIDKKLKPEKLKNFIDADQLDNINNETVDNIIEEIKGIAYKNIITELLKENVDFNKIPVTQKYISNHLRLKEELHIDYDYRISKLSNFDINDDGQMYCSVSIAKINKKNNSKVPKSFIILKFDKNGSIDDLEIFYY